MEYNSERELFEDLKGAFKVKLRMIEGKYDNISMLDIYDYLKLNKWRYANDLTISEIVNDIIDVDIAKVEDYIESRKEETVI